MRGRTNKHMFKLDKNACRKGKRNTGQDKVTVKIPRKKPTTDPARKHQRNVCTGGTTHYGVGVGRAFVMGNDFLLALEMGGYMRKA